MIETNLVKRAVCLLPEHVATRFQREFGERQRRGVGERGALPVTNLLAATRRALARIQVDVCGARGELMSSRRGVRDPLPTPPPLLTLPFPPERS